MKNLKKTSSHFLLWTLLLTVFTSCIFNENCEDKSLTSSKEIPSRAKYYILCEGSFKQNNSVLSLFNAQTAELLPNDVYEMQNKKRLGDTANDMFFYDDNIYVVVNGSERIVKLNKDGVEQASFQNFKDLGSPRYGVAHNGKIYVSCYGGYVAKFDAKTLQLEGRVKVNANPEELVVNNNLLYCVNSGFGEGKTLSVINLHSFVSVDNITIVYNPTGIKQDHDNLYITATNHDAAWTFYQGEVYRFNAVSKQCTKISDATRVLAANNLLYMVNEVTTTKPNFYNTFTIYNPATQQITTWNLSDAKDKTLQKHVYMIEQNPSNGDFFLGVTDYKTNGIIYQYDKDGHFIREFSAGGINPNSMLFL